MQIKNLLFRNFRNYQEQSIKLNPGINVFCGLNGHGKTNILEAIYFLTVGRSFRTRREKELIKWDKQFFFIRGKLIKGKEQYLVEAGYHLANRFLIKVNASPSTRGDHISRFPSVVFSPDDISLIKGGPHVRRQFLNVEGSRLHNIYLNYLKQYYRVLQQRNSILKDIKTGNWQQNDILSPWNQALIDKGSFLVKARVRLLSDLSRHASAFYHALTSNNEKIGLQYLCSFRYNNVDMLEKDFEINLKKNLRNEIFRGNTLLGPHLDDFLILMDERNSKIFASQGQQRTAIIALRLAQVELYYEKTGIKPIVLLDDVFSELDEERRSNLYRLLIEKKVQCFITATSPDHFVTTSPDELSVFQIREGKIYIE